MITRSVIFLSVLLAIGFCSSSNDEVPEPDDADAHLNLSELVTKYGYSIQQHFVRTADGYVLTLYRIPYGRNCRSMLLKKPVLLQHGLLSSAFDFLILGPKKSLGYLLADSCYDVWLGNNRGNSQSRSHLNMTTNSRQFWKFTWHEMGQYDIPAMIDYILNATQQPSLHYVGHSQGTTQFFVFGALHPEYHGKVRSMHALSPVAFMKHLSSPLIKTFALFYQVNEFLANLVGLDEFLPQSQFANLLGSKMCKDQFPTLQNLCGNVFFLLCGFDEPQLNKTILPAILGHVPAGAATKQFVHYAQGITSGHFRHFDHGLVKNLKIYKSLSPPDYDLTKIDIPIALYYGANDWLASIKDVKSLMGKLPNVIEDYLVPYTKFNHLDFLFAIDVKFLLYDRVIQVLEKHA